MMTRYYQQSIKEWGDQDQPREKFLNRGVDSLTDAELLALLMGSGNRDFSAIDLGRLLIDQFGGVDELAKASLHELMEVKGVGKAKATAISGAFELCRRRRREKVETKRFVDSFTAARYLSGRLADLPHEEFHILYLNPHNELIREKVVSVGGVSYTILDPKIVFKEALNCLASSIILAHNHPSGNLKPSRDDIKLTEKIKHAASFFDIIVKDHLIISQRGFYSFADHNKL